MTHPVLVLDLETTGLHPAHDRILEVGAILCGPLPDLDVIDTYHAVIACPTWIRSEVPDDVRAMHDANGLWVEAFNSPTTTAQAAEGLLALLARHDATGAMLGGSGVGPFDFAFLRAWMPEVAERLHYRVLDVSPIRTFLAGHPGLAPIVDAWQASQGDKAHRALDDARSHRDELLHYGTALISQMVF